MSVQFKALSPHGGLSLEATSRLGRSDHVDPRGEPGMSPNWWLTIPTVSSRSGPSLDLESTLEESNSVTFTGETIRQRL